MSLRFRSTTQWNASPTAAPKSNVLNPVTTAARLQQAVEQREQQPGIPWFDRPGNGPYALPGRLFALWPIPEWTGKERDRAAKLGPHSGLGTWGGTRVAPLRCPILRPSEIGCTVSGGVQQHFMHFLTAVRRLAAPLGNPPHEAAGCALRTERAESQWANENSQLTGLDIQRATHNIQRSDILAV